MGMGVALVLDQSQLADPRIGLAQAHSELLRQSHQPLARPVEQFGVGRKHHRLRTNGLLPAADIPTQSLVGGSPRRPTTTAGASTGMLALNHCGVFLPLHHHRSPGLSAPGLSKSRGSKRKVFLTKHRQRALPALLVTRARATGIYMPPSMGRAVRRQVLVFLLNGLPPLITSERPPSLF